MVSSRTDLFPVSSQAGILLRLQKIPLFTFYDFEEHHDMVLNSETGVYAFQKNKARTVNPAADPYLEMFVNGCTDPGETGVFNAFYAWLPGAGEAMVVCPGFIEKSNY